MENGGVCCQPNSSVPLNAQVKTEKLKRKSSWETCVTNQRKRYLPKPQIHKSLTGLESAGGINGAASDRLENKGTPKWPMVSPVTQAG